MAYLSDMEELLSRIQNKSITDYMREALACYNGGAFRGCIVMSFICLFDDLRQKLAQLAKVSSVAKKISHDVEQRIEQQQVFETSMIDQLKAERLLSESDAWRLERLRDLRNKAAHPSGIHASAEEARFVYFEVIDKFLSKPILQTTHAVDEILSRLGNSNFFPDKKIDTVAAIVSGEIASVHQQAIPYLVTQLVAAVDAPESDLARNAERFLVGLARSNRAEINKELRSRLIKSRADRLESTLDCYSGRQLQIRLSWRSWIKTQCCAWQLPSGKR